MSKLIRISESDDWTVDYDRERGMYRVSYFQDGHFVDEHWFDCYEEKEVKHKDRQYDHIWDMYVDEFDDLSKEDIEKIAEKYNDIPLINPITKDDLEKMGISFDEWQHLGYSEKEAKEMVEASKVYI